MTVKCDCGKLLRVPENSAGRKARCPGCGSTFRVHAAPGVGGRTDKIRFWCACGQKLSAPTSAAGRRVHCTTCDALLVVPCASRGPDAPVSSEAPSLGGPGSDTAAGQSADAAPPPPVSVPGADEVPPAASDLLAMADIDPPSPAPPEQSAPPPVPVPAVPDHPYAPRTAPSGILESFPVAEMAVKAGLAVWVVLTFFMVAFYTVRSSFGLLPALVLLGAAAAFFAGAVVAFLGAHRNWIAADTRDPDEARIHGIVRDLAARSGLPMPKVALVRDEKEINAYTYGLTQRSARIVVTGGFMEHVKPTDAELEAVLAHELGHIRHRDCAVSTFLQFPIWTMDRLRSLMRLGIAFIRAVAVRSASALGEMGWVGLIIFMVMIIAILILLYYSFILAVALWVCMMFLNAFSREREYLADLFAARASGGAEPLQRALASLEAASARVSDELRKRADKAKDGEEVDPHVDAPAEKMNVDHILRESIADQPSALSIASFRECFLSHPLSARRIYYLEYPDKRKRLFSWILDKIERGAALAFRHPVERDDWYDAATLAICSALGVAVAAVTAYSQQWRWLIALGAAFLVTGVFFGWRTARLRWSGRMFVRLMLLGSFCTATALLLIGPVLNSPLWPAFWGIFVAALVLYVTPATVAAAVFSRREAVVSD